MKQVNTQKSNPWGYSLKKKSKMLGNLPEILSSSNTETTKDTQQIICGPRNNQSNFYDNSISLLEASVHLSSLNSKKCANHSDPNIEALLDGKMKTDSEMDIKIVRETLQELLNALVTKSTEFKGNEGAEYIYCNDINLRGVRAVLETIEYNYIAKGCEVVSKENISNQNAFVQSLEDEKLNKEMLAPQIRIIDFIKQQINI